MERSLGSAGRGSRGQYAASTWWINALCACRGQGTWLLIFNFLILFRRKIATEMAQSRLLDILFLAFILAVFFPSGECIHCWDCNSAYDPRCGDPFDNHSIALVDCSQMSYQHLPDIKATLCRKTTQKVNGVMRVVRGCGWLNSTHEDGGLSCFQRSGSQDVYLTHCTCFADGCNAGHWFKPNTFLFVLPIFLLIATRFL